MEKSTQIIPNTYMRDLLRSRMVTVVSGEPVSGVQRHMQLSSGLGHCFLLVLKLFLVCADIAKSGSDL